MLLVILGFYSNKLHAQSDSTKTSPLKLSGSVDAYFRTNLNANDQISENDDAPTIDTAPKTSFANLPGFSLGMANVIVSLEGKKSGLVTDLVFGPRGEDAVFKSPQYSKSRGSSQILNQLYAYWEINKKIKCTIGDFNTYLGYEVISPSGNFHYSTSYMFSYGPFSHTGLKLDVDLGRGISLMTAIMNDTDVTEFNASGHYFGGVQVGYKEMFLNFLFDKSFFQVDYTAQWNVSKKSSVGVNATFATDNFVGAALYLQKDFSKEFSLGLRSEYFKDLGVNIFANNSAVFDFTLTGNYRIGGLTLIPEFRIDALTNDTFTTKLDKTHPLDINLAKKVPSLSSFLFAAVYTF